MTKILNSFLDKIGLYASRWRHPGAITLALATTIHLTEGAVLCVTDAANKSTPIAALIRNVPPLVWNLTIEQNLTIWLFASASLALISMYSRHLPHWAAAALLVPQQWLLAITFIGAIIETIQGHYADGYVAPSIFIFVDQITRILLCPAYTVSIFMRAYWPADGHTLKQIVRE